MSMHSLGHDSIEMIPTSEEKSPPNTTDSGFESVSMAEVTKSELINDQAKEPHVQTGRLEEKDTCVNDDTKPTTPETKKEKPAANNSDHSKSSMGLQSSRKQSTPSKMQLLRSKHLKNLQRRLKINAQRYLPPVSAKKRIEQSSDRLQLDSNVEKSVDTCGGSNVSCIVCNEKFYNKLEFRKHAAIEHPDVSIVFCDSCSESFVNEHDLSSHKTSRHVKSTRREILKRRRKIKLMKRLTNFSTGSQVKFYLRSFMQSSIQRKKSSGARRKLLLKRHLIERITSEKSLNVNSSSPKDENIIKDPLNNSSGLENDVLSRTNITTVEQIESNADEQTTNTTLESDQMHRDIVACKIIPDSGTLSNIYAEDFSAGTKIKPPTGETNEHQKIVLDQTTVEIRNLDPQLMTGEANTLNISTTSSSTNPTNQTAETVSKSCKTYEVKLTTRPGSFTESDFCIMCSQIFGIIDQKNPKLSTRMFLRCPLCSFQVTSRYLLKRHIASDHLNCDCIKPTQLTDAKIFESSTSDLFICKPMVHPVYPCVHCAKIFVSYNKLASHILTFHDLKPPMREKSTANQPEYLRILKNNIVQSRPFGKTVSTATAGSNIQLTSLGSSSLINCVYCPRRFTKCRPYIHHINEQHQDFTIKYNKYSFGDSSPVIDSVVESSGEVSQLSEGIFMDAEVPVLAGSRRRTCKICLKIFRSLKELSNHYYSVHNDKQNSMVSAVPYKRNDLWKCIQCPYTFKMMQSYIRHKYLMHNDDSMVHICENCCKILTSVPMVNTHICVNAYSWSCQPCNATFSSSMALRLHRNIYHVENAGPHICTLCQRTFLTNSMLQRHLETHQFNANSKHESSTTLMLDEYTDEVALTEEFPIKIEQNEEKFIENYKVSPPMQNMNEFNTDIYIKSEPKASQISSPCQTTDETGAVYRCTLCRLDFAAKSVLDVHLNRAHTSAVEICQLCYQMVFTGSLVRHIIDNHLPRDLKAPLFRTVKQEDLLGNNLQTIEKDTEELIQKIGKQQLLALCEYNKYTDQTQFDEVFCADCLVKIDNCAEFRRHNVQVHDKMCALCNMQFESGEEAATHKTNSHGSIACYVWFAQKVVAAIEDTQAFTDTANEMINEATQSETYFFAGEIENPSHPEQIFLEDMTEIIPNDNYSNIDDQMQCNQLEDPINHEFIDNSIEDLIECPVENQIEEVQGPQESIPYAKEEYDLLEENDETPKVLLIVTEDDLEKYRDNIPDLARKIGLNHNITIGKEVIEMLQAYVRIYLEE